DCAPGRSCQDNVCVVLNATCDAPQELALDTPVRGDTTNAGRDRNGTCGGSDQSTDHAFAFTPASDGVHCFSLAGSDYDTVLHVRVGDCAAPERERGCNDDAPQLTGEARTSALNVNLAVGTIYFAIVDGFDGAAGTYQLRVSEGGCVPPAP
ncbi:MAG: hypothetical protein KC583_04555, partial [Myxococcales bacterium]|nr:hypothetical protein [Myxococcales bacterium]